MNLLFAVLVSIPIYITPCMEHPTCLVEEPPPPPPTVTTTITTTTTAPAPEPEPEPESDTYQGMGSGVEQWRSLVAAYFPASEVDTALRVMKCESGGNPTAKNPSSGAAGLMQVMPDWAPEFGVSYEALFDPDTNMSISYALWLDGGWSHWTCY